jgi:uncharacterized protein YecT (DUF1311 family)
MIVGRLLAAVLAATTMAAAPDQGPVGRYKVVRVLIDPATDNSQRTLYRDDPRLVERLAILTATSLTIDRAGHACRGRRTVQRTTVAAALARLPRRPGSGRRPSPSPAELGLNAIPRQPVMLTTYRCDVPGPDGTISSLNRSAVFPIESRRLAMIFGGEVVLILAPVVASSRAAAPSFACDKARSPTEKTICADPDLAAWDRSVANAVAKLIAGDSDYPAVDDIGAFREQQRGWLIERDTCRTNRSCLADSMAERLEDLLAPERRIGR